MPLLDQVIGKEPPPPSDGSGFQANGPVDMRHLTELALVAGATAANYSNELANTFTITRAGIDFVIDGSFTYTGGLPDPGGTVGSITVNADRYIRFSHPSISRWRSSTRFSLLPIHSRSSRPCLRETTPTLRKVRSGVPGSATRFMASAARTDRRNRQRQQPSVWRRRR
jgi:hypothetical protein